MNPLTDELSDDAKAELAAIFADLRHRLHPWDVRSQRFLNRTWNLTNRNLP